ncbi:unnamed protein product [Clonostachys rosea f. rosea IK726]|uniref:(4-O-methyl)-D-glucuronate--lignin esterase n=2 Tax=Bionectria ochroleuca TaxID=29856 RepID=A0A0B7JSV4_BIOOC|nr:unnamed protein product [Clonostachys rosea f. rosea IK726]
MAGGFIKGYLSDHKNSKYSKYSNYIYQKNIENIMIYVLSVALLFGFAVTALPATPVSPLLERQACSPSSNIPAVSTTYLPDPFVFADGTRVTSVDQWSCRQQEILNAYQQYEFGDLPPAPSSLTASLSGNTLSITVSVSGKSSTFTASISGRSGSSAQPAIIAIGGYSIPIPSGVATITFNNDGFAQQNGGGSRGIGTFYDLHGNGHSAGALTAWAWGVSRIIDALEKLGSSATGIDTTRLGVTGCSRNGKGAFVVGALDKRIALTIPQESGAGGAACWRISDAEKALGKNIQTASQIVGENVWFSTRFNQWTSKTNTLPYDHHLLAGLIAPRGLYVPENVIDWLGPVSTTACMRAGRLIYKALGKQQNMGVSVAAAHNHCQFPSSQNSELTEFINYFLLKGSSAPQDLDKSAVSADVNKYINWSVPTLA